MTAKEVAGKAKAALKALDDNLQHTVFALGGLAESISGGLAGAAILAGAVGGALLVAGALLRFLPGTSADMRQTATRMIEGGAILLAIVGAGSLILGGANWLGQQISGAFGGQGTPVDQGALNPWRR